MLSSNDNPQTPPPLTCPHPKIYSRTKPAASSHRQLFPASSVNVRSKVHPEIMEHVTFFLSLSLRAGDIAPEEPERFGWEGVGRRGEDGWG